MLNASAIDKNNSNKINGVDWGLIPIPQSYNDLYKNYGNPQNPNFSDNFLIELPHTYYTVDPSNKNNLITHQINVVSHVAMVPALHDVFLNCAHLINSYDGCYVYRNVRGESNLSLHSWGLAIDLNAATNPLGSTSPPSFQPQALVETFKKHGFFWGGNYNHRKDPMHFQRAGDF